MGLVNDARVKFKLFFKERREEREREKEREREIWIFWTP